MAIYHLSVKPMSRKTGRSACAAIAYRTAEKVHDLSSDQVFDYTRKRGVEHTEIVLSTEAAKQDINWARDRQALWNAAEMAEKRKDARVAREYEVALPHELNRSQRVELVRAFSAEIANRYGVAVDFAIHAPHRHGDERNHHAHLMTTTREITATGLGAKSDIELGDRDRGKKGLPAAKVEIEEIRERWAVLTNEYLKEHQIEARIDHRSLQAQGIEREPTSHLGPAVSGMERRGMETEVGQRLVQERAVEAEKKVERTVELVQLRGEQQALKVSMLDLSAALSLARRERELKPALGRPGPESEAAQTPAERLVQRVKERAQELGKAAWRPPGVTAQRGLFEDLEAAPPGGGAPEKDAAAQTVRSEKEALDLRNRLLAEMVHGPKKSEAEPSLEAGQTQTPEGSPRREIEADIESPERRPGASPEFDLEQVKEQGRAAAQRWADELAQQKTQELERQQELRRSRGRGRGRGRGLGLGRDGPDFDLD